jgi:beta-glucanase (GH16 family)
MRNLKLKMICRIFIAAPFPPVTVFMLMSSYPASVLNIRYAPAGYQLVWEDGFNGSVIDTASWIVGSLRDPNNGDLVPGARGDRLLNQQYSGYITSDNAYIDDGVLVLRNRKVDYAGVNPKGDYKYTSAWVMSMHRVFFNKGYVEIKAKFPSGDKVWPALWLIAEDLTWGPEWDMFEYFGYREDVGFDNMGVHLATGKSPQITWNSGWLKDFDKTFDCERWHIYGFEWTKEMAAWYIDGKKVNELQASGIPLWPDEDMYMVFNNGQRSQSPDSATVWPNYLKIDYVKLFKKSP